MYNPVPVLTLVSPRESQVTAKIKTISEAELVVIRQRVIRDARDGRTKVGLFGLGEDVQDLGIKNHGMILSALDRQHVGLGGILKYRTPHLNAATLAFGLAKNHGYHDGNKRTALVAMLAHLDKNGVLVCGVEHDRLAGVMENIARDVIPVDKGVQRTGVKASRLGASRALRGAGERLASDAQADRIVDDLARFLETCSRDRVRGGFRSVTYKKLRPLLEEKGFVLVGPVPGNKMQVMRPRKRSLVERFLGGGSELKNVATIAWPGDSRTLDQASLARIRQQLSLTEMDGVDDAAFYDFAESVDVIVNEYRGVLRRLETR